ncbi:testicular acid phosphatase homolog [Rhipicephalus microplus]|uniref:testicular acid phosphatase homolog n=1 Tax=Rhipicephalus microplus TaxID=6941 RepID=UPI003F6AB72E
MQLAILLLLPLALASEPFYRRNDLLKHVVVILRHTDRAPLATYPGDPYKNHDWPLGYGRLTSRGRANARALGKWLRSHYNDFLSDDPREVDARSSPAPRCYETAALVLYGLYPANAVQREWEPDQPWQPVPITRLPDGNDKYSTICVPRVRAAIRSLIAVPEPAFLADNATLRKPLFGTLGGIVGFVARMSNLSEESSSGLFVTAIKMLDTMSVAKEYNLPVPTWASKYWRHLHWASEMAHEALCRSQMNHFGGALIRDALNDIGPTGEPLARPSSSLMRGDPDPSDTPKMTLRVYHDVNLGGILIGLNGTLGKRAPYGAAILVELFTLASTVTPDVYVRVLYKAGDTVSTLALQGCSNPCSLQSFRELLERNFGPVSRSECEWNDNQPLL